MWLRKIVYVTVFAERPGEWNTTLWLPSLIRTVRFLPISDYCRLYTLYSIVFRAQATKTEWLLCKVTKTKQQAKNPCSNKLSCQWNIFTLVRLSHNVTDPNYFASQLLSAAAYTHFFWRHNARYVGSVAYLEFFSGGAKSENFPQIVTWLNREYTYIWAWYFKKINKLFPIL